MRNARHSMVGVLYREHMLTPRITLLGIPLDPVTQSETLQRMHSFLVQEGQQRHVATPNSEMLVEASRNPAFRTVLQHTSLNLPDSRGLLLMARLWGQRILERVTGADTMRHLCSSIGPEHPVFLLGAAPGIAERAAEKLQKLNPRLRIAGTFAGSPQEEDAPAIIACIHAAAPHLLFVAYGAPAQELWIARHLCDCPTVRVAMGVGGAFDFLAGAQRRAPRWMQRVGLEWIWRVVLEPKRLPRIINAVVVFPVMCLWERMRV